MSPRRPSSPRRMFSLMPRDDADRPPTARLRSEEPPSPAEPPELRSQGSGLLGGLFQKLGRKNSFSRRPSSPARFNEPKPSVSPDERTERSGVSTISDTLSNSPAPSSARPAAPNTPKQFDDDLDDYNARVQSRETPGKDFVARPSSPAMRGRQQQQQWGASAPSSSSAAALSDLDFDSGASASDLMGQVEAHMLSSRDQQRREVVLRVAERSRQRALLKLAVAAAREAEEKAHTAWEAASAEAEQADGAYKAAMVAAEGAGAAARAAHSRGGHLGEFAAAEARIATQASEVAAKSLAAATSRLMEAERSLATARAAKVAAERDEAELLRVRETEQAAASPPLRGSGSSSTTTSTGLAWRRERDQAETLRRKQQAQAAVQAAKEKKRADAAVAEAEEARKVQAAAEAEARERAVEEERSAMAAKAEAAEAAARAAQAEIAKLLAAQAETERVREEERERERAELLAELELLRQQTRRQSEEAGSSSSLVRSSSSLVLPSPPQQQSPPPPPQPQPQPPSSQLPTKRPPISTAEPQPPSPLSPPSPHAAASVMAAVAHAEAMAAAAQAEASSPLGGAPSSSVSPRWAPSSASPTRKQPRSPAKAALPPTMAPASLIVDAPASPAPPPAAVMVAKSPTTDALFVVRTQPIVTPPHVTTPPSMAPVASVPYVTTPPALAPVSATPMDVTDAVVAKAPSPSRPPPPPPEQRKVEPPAAAQPEPEPQPPSPDLPVVRARPHFAQKPKPPPAAAATPSPPGVIRSSSEGSATVNNVGASPRSMQPVAQAVAFATFASHPAALCDGGTQTSFENLNKPGLLRKQSTLTGMHQSALDEVDAFLEQVAGMLARRRRGEKFDHGVNDAYLLSLVSMTDEHIQEMYKVFSLLDGSGPPSPRLDEGEAADHAAAVSEAEAEKAALLERLGAGDGPLDETSKKFLEMVTNKLGECIGTQQFVRVSLHKQGVKERAMAEAQNERVRAEQQARQAAKRKEEERLAAERAAENELNQEVWDAIGYIWPLLAKPPPEGVEMKEIRRFKNHPELRLLLIEDRVAMNRVPTHEWRSMACSGLRQQEMRCLLHAFNVYGTPKLAEGFSLALSEKVKRPKTEAAYLELLQPPAWALPFRPQPPPPPQAEEAEAPSSSWFGDMPGKRTAARAAAACAASTKGPSSSATSATAASAAARAAGATKCERPFRRWCRPFKGVMAA